MSAKSISLVSNEQFVRNSLEQLSRAEAASADELLHAVVSVLRALLTREGNDADDVDRMIF